MGLLVPTVLDPAACTTRRMLERPPSQPSGATSMRRPSTSSVRESSASSLRAQASKNGLLLARPGKPTAASAATGKRALGIGKRRDGFVYVPPGVSATDPRPLVVFFHGSGGAAGQAAMILPAAEERRVLVLSIDSRGASWDVIVDELGPDVAFLDAALEFTFRHHAIDSARIAVSGFSDGASYALSLGLANGELFTDVLALSPGFSAAPQVRGKPRVFVSHGRSDAVLPIDACSRRIVPRLESTGYTVRYREFDGPHTVPAPIVSEAFEWFLR